MGLFTKPIISTPIVVTKANLMDNFAKLIEQWGNILIVFIMYGYKPVYSRLVKRVALALEAKGLSLVLETPTIPQSTWRTTLYQYLMNDIPMTAAQRAMYADMEAADLLPIAAEIIKANPTYRADRTFNEFKAEVVAASEG